MSDEACVSWCPQCGPGVSIDEDGCCESCGATATGAWASRAIEQAAEVTRLTAQLAHLTANAGPDSCAAELATAEQRTAEAIAAWLEDRGDSCNPVNSARLIREGKWRK